MPKTLETSIQKLRTGLRKGFKINSNPTFDIFDVITNSLNLGLPTKFWGEIHRLVVDGKTVIAGQYFLEQDFRDAERFYVFQKN